MVQSYVLVSDTGDNDHDRATVSILKFPEPEGVGSDLTVAEADIEKLELRYEGFSYDCEALGRCHQGSCQEYAHCSLELQTSNEPSLRFHNHGEGP